MSLLWRFSGKCFYEAIYRYSFHLDVCNSLAADLLDCSGWMFVFYFQGHESNFQFSGDTGFNPSDIFNVVLPGWTLDVAISFWRDFTWGNSWKRREAQTQARANASSGWLVQLWAWSWRTKQKLAPQKVTQKLSVTQRQTTGLTGSDMVVRWWGR